MEEKGMEREITPEQTPIEVSTKASEISGDEEEVQEVRLPDLNAAYEEKEREARLKENPEHSQETAQEDTAKQDETVGSKEEGNITDNDVEVFVGAFSISILFNFLSPFPFMFHDSFNSFRNIQLRPRHKIVKLFQVQRVKLMPRFKCLQSWK